jgi:(S)-mandelate dehydrogenase
MPALPGVEVELFGRKYAAPIGIPPMGGPALAWPGGDAALARAAQRARVPYVLGTVGGITIEEAAQLAPDVLWFQLYRLARNDHALGIDLVRRAEAAEAHVLVLTIDVPVRTTRSREAAVGLGRGPFRPTLPMLVDMLRSPAWLAALMRHGRPKFSNFRAYAGPDASGDEVIRFTRQELGGGFTWLDVIRAVALGAHTTFAGKAFLRGQGAAGEAGPGHVIDLLIEEARAALGQIGAHTLAQARSVVIRHPGALAFPQSPP